MGVQWGRRAASRVSVAITVRVECLGGVHSALPLLQLKQADQLRDICSMARNPPCPVHVGSVGASTTSAGSPCAIRSVLRHARPGSVWRAVVGGVEDDLVWVTLPHVHVRISHPDPCVADKWNEGNQQRMVGEWWGVEAACGMSRPSPRLFLPDPDSATATVAVPAGTVDERARSRRDDRAQWATMRDRGAVTAPYGAQLGWQRERRGGRGRASSPCSLFWRVGGCGGWEVDVVGTLGVRHTGGIDPLSSPPLSSVHTCRANRARQQCAAHPIYGDPPKTWELHYFEVCKQYIAPRHR